MRTFIGARVFAHTCRAPRSPSHIAALKARAQSDLAAAGDAGVTVSANDVVCAYLWKVRG